MTKYWKQIKIMQISQNRYFLQKNKTKSLIWRHILSIPFSKIKTGLSFTILFYAKYDFDGLTMNIIQYKINFSNKHVVVFFCSIMWTIFNWNIVESGINHHQLFEMKLNVVVDHHCLSIRYSRYIDSTSYTLSHTFL
jgi:hypothetical protein